MRSRCKRELVIIALKRFRLFMYYVCLPNQSTLAYQDLWSISFFPWYTDTGTHPCQALTTICSHVLLVSVDYTASMSLRQIPKFHLISFCGNFVERHSLRRVLGNLPETTETVPFHKISTPGFGIWRSVYYILWSVSYFRLLWYI